MKKNKTQESLAGEYAVLSQLALRGFDASLTLGNTKGVDILVSNPANDDMFRVEVKTTIKNTGEKISHSELFGDVENIWMLSEKNESIINDKLLYCLVSIDSKTNIFSYYIVPSKIVANYLKAEAKLWFGAEKRKITKTAGMRHFRLGVKNFNYKIPTPIANDYKNNWNLLK